MTAAMDMIDETLASASKRASSKDSGTSTGEGEVVVSTDNETVGEAEPEKTYYSEQKMSNGKHILQCMAGRLIGKTRCPETQKVP